MRAYVWMSCGMYFMNGLSSVVLGTVLPSLLAHYGASYTLGGFFVFLQFAGYLIGVPASAMVVRRSGHRVAIMISAACIGVAEATIGSLPMLDIALLMSCLNGIGLSMMQTTISSSLIEWFEGRRAVIMSRMEVAFGLGCLIIPLFESRLIATGSWRVGFTIVGILSLLLACVWPLISIKPETNSNEGPRDAHTRVPDVTGFGAKAILITLFLTMIFLYVGLESCFNNFLPAIFMSYLGRSNSVASLTVTVFWTSMVMGRTLTGWVIRKVSYSSFLCGSIGTTLVLLMVMATWRNVILDYVMTFLIGLSMSGIFVITLVFANHTFPGRGPHVTRLVTIFAGVGGAAIPGIFGWLMDHLTVTQNLWILAGFTLVLLSILATIVSMKSSSTVDSRLVKVDSIDGV